ncbi:hypothetical protein [Lactobacillus amylovorus]|uniref:hypothetical protein n=1 Tax=Lactobacillus amylovorus TaxID=1604 RepID=UPI0021CA9593|nr:hypothetical protein [Lactobacillus amylovorus]UXN12913.1 hypothetical protein N6G93_10615 [Lactobacillus amylovorus]
MNTESFIFLKDSRYFSAFFNMNAGVNIVNILNSYRHHDYRHAISDVRTIEEELVKKILQIENYNNIDTGNLSLNDIIAVIRNIYPSSITKYMYIIKNIGNNYVHLDPSVQSKSEIEQNHDVRTTIILIHDILAYCTNRYENKGIKYIFEDKTAEFTNSINNYHKYGSPNMPVSYTNGSNASYSRNNTSYRSNASYNSSNNYSSYRSNASYNSSNNYSSYNSSSNYSNNTNSDDSSSNFTIYLSLAVMAAIVIGIIWFAIDFITRPSLSEQAPSRFGGNEYQLQIEGQGNPPNPIYNGKQIERTELPNFDLTTKVYVVLDPSEKTHKLLVLYDRHGADKAAESSSTFKRFYKAAKAHTTYNYSNDSKLSLHTNIRDLSVKYSEADTTWDSYIYLSQYGLDKLAILANKAFLKYSVDFSDIDAQQNLTVDYDKVKFKARMFSPDKSADTGRYFKDELDLKGYYDISFKLNSVD